jgi:hypothetical protein
VKPTVRALASSGKRGRTVRLRYIANDNSGTTRETVLVSRRSRRVKTITTRFGESNGGRYFTTWRVSRRAKTGRYRFCVRSADAAGNTSAFSCARLTIRR